MKNPKMGRPKIPANKRLISKSITLSQEHEAFLSKQKTNVSLYIRELIEKAMKEADNNASK